MEWQGRGFDFRLQSDALLRLLSSTASSQALRPACAHAPQAAGGRQGVGGALRRARPAGRGQRAAGGADRGRATQVPGPGRPIAAGRPQDLPPPLAANSLGWQSAASLRASAYFASRACSALEDGYVAILEVRAAEAAQLASRCLTEQQYQLRRGAADLLRGAREHGGE